MKTLGNIIWHVLSLGFITAIFVYLFGLLLTVTVVAAPIGLGLMELGKFLFAPFGNAMVDQKDLNVSQNQAWKVFSTIVRICYFPFGLLLAIAAVFQIVTLFVTLIGIPAALVVSGSLGTYFNPVGKKCVPKAVADELARRRAERDVARHLGGAELIQVEAAREAAPMLLAAPQATFDSGPVCPVCGTENPAGSKFCRKDGTPLGRETPRAAEPPKLVVRERVIEPERVAAAPAVPPAPAAERGKGRLPIPALAAAAGVVIIGAGFWLYWKGVVGDRQGSVAANLQSELTMAGYSGVTVQIDRGWVATVAGNVVGRDAHDRMLAQVRSNAAIANVIDGTTVTASAAELQAVIQRELLAQGYANVRVDAAENSAMILSGTFDSEAQRDSALRDVRSVQGVASVVDRTERSLIWRQRDANQLLSGAGLPLVTANYIDATTLALNGQVSDNDARSQAEELMHGADANARIVNNIQVILPPIQNVSIRQPQGGASARSSGAPATPVVAPAPAKMSPEAILGTWNTTAAAGRNIATLEFTDLTPGNRRAGKVRYLKTDCSFRLELISAQENVLEYRERQSNALKVLVCGSGAQVRIEMRNATEAVAQASNPSTGRVLGSVELVKQ